MTISCDVAIVGGGPAGATTARILASWGHHVVLVEAAAAPSDKVGEVLAPSARPILASLDLLERLDSDPLLARHCLGIVSDWGGPHRRDFLREPGGHGWILDRRRFEDALARAAVAAGVDWRWQHRLKGVERRPGGYSLTASRPGATSDPALARIEAAFVVDASGRAAVLARRLNGKRRTATRLLARDLGAAPEAAGATGPAWISIAAGPDGWRYAAEGPGGRRHRLLMSAAPASMPRAGRAWEAGFSILDRVHGDRWLAIGDAAAAFDPITSQGIPQALASGLAAAHAVHAALGGEMLQAGAYADSVLATWCRSLAQAKAVYQAERRWQALPFWAAAQAQLPPPR